MQMTHNVAREGTAVMASLNGLYDELSICAGGTYPDAHERRELARDLYEAEGVEYCAECGEVIEGGPAAYGLYGETVCAECSRHEARAIG